MSTIAKPCIKMQPAAGLDINQFFNLVSEYVILYHIGRRGLPPSGFFVKNYYKTLYY